jgi:hypothetical protein
VVSGMTLGAQHRGLRNSVVGLGTTPVWSMVSLARVEDDGGA